MKCNCKICKCGDQVCHLYKILELESKLEIAVQALKRIKSPYTGSFTDGDFKYDQEAEKSPHSVASNALIQIESVDTEIK